MIERYNLHVSACLYEAICVDKGILQHGFPCWIECGQRKRLPSGSPLDRYADRVPLLGRDNSKP